ncbi:MAG: hypothetical protein N2171_01970 [Clostridia bacterium]|nr:hypothetical protein [Clostridia bacterium]
MYSLIPISDGEYSTLLGMNGGQPESPDGKHIVYARKKEIDNPEKQLTEIWICDRDNLSNHKKVFEIDCGNHNGPSATFLDNSHIVFRGSIKDMSVFHILNVDTGKIVCGPIAAKESHCAENGKYPFSISENFLDKNPDYPMLNSCGIYTLDFKTGSIEKIVDAQEIIDMVKSAGYTPNEWTTSMSHVQLNPSATSVMMRLSVNECKIFGALGAIDLATRKTHFIPDKPVHQLWYDDNSYMATYQRHNGKEIEMASSRIKRYSKDGEVIEVLGGIGNHIDGSSDRKWFVGDSAYPGNPLNIFLYQKGEIEPAAVLDTHNFQYAVWKLQVHPNPTFSRDGKRIYFNRPISENKTQAVYVDISDIVK